MSRLVVPPTLQVYENATMEGNRPNLEHADDYKSRLAKYIPVEATGGYVALNNLSEVAANSANNLNSSSTLIGKTIQSFTHFLTLPLTVFLFCLVFAPVYVWYLARRTGNAAWKAQAAIAFAAFAIWAYAIKGKLFEDGLAHDPLAASVMLVFFSMLIAFYEPKPTQ